MTNYECCDAINNKLELDGSLHVMCNAKGLARFARAPRSTGVQHAFTTPTVTVSRC